MIHCTNLSLPYLSANQGRLDLRLEPGQRWAIIGANGAGKSLLLACLAGWQMPLSGRVDWSLAPGLNTAPVWAARVSYQPAQVSLPFAETLAERLQLKAGLLNEPRCQALLDRFALRPLLVRNLQTASSGEQQRAWLVARLMQSAAVVMLDEPLAHLDFEFQAALGQTLATDSRLSLCVVHQPEWALRFCTHILALTRSGEYRQARVEQVDGDFLSATYGVPFTEAKAVDGTRHWVRTL
jgi:iron complex transport system ATP-binding protein